MVFVFFFFFHFFSSFFLVILKWRKSEKRKEGIHVGFGWDYISMAYICKFPWVNKLPMPSSE